MKLATRVLLGCLFFAVVGTGAQSQVTTYHYDNQRTGWNPNETILTPATVGGLQMIASVPLDDEVDAQPLVYNGVVYVVTENNTVYAIDTLGNVIAQNNLGPPVNTSSVNGCNSGNVGITSTPAIDPGSSTLYVMVYTYDGSGNPTYRLHALNTGLLNDNVAPVTVTASGKLTNGSTYYFNASVTRQRPGLLLSVNGNVYAGFGSYCDLNPLNSITRGWLLGWQAGSLTPLSNNYLVNRLATDVDDFFLTSIWMSGAGIAEDGSANLFFSTGNSGPSGNDYRPRSNLSESVIQLSPDLSTVETYFTPYGGTLGGHYLEQNDLDMSAGGVLVLPDGNVVIAGKNGEMYLLTQGNLGGNAPRNYVARVSIGSCWCTESYFVGPDGVGRVVSSGGNQMVQVWLEPSFALESQSPQVNGNGQGGFFTSVSSNGTQSPIVWVVDRPGDDVPGCELSVRMVKGHEPLPVDVAQKSALPPDRLSDEKPGSPAAIERGRVELDEFHIDQDGPGAKRNGHPLAGRDRRVGTLAVQAAGSPRGEHDRRPVEILGGGAIGPRDDGRECSGGGASEGSEHRALPRFNARFKNPRAQRLFDVQSGRVTAGVDDACARVSRLAAERNLPLHGVEGNPVADEVRDAVRCLPCEDSRRAHVDNPSTGPKGVGEMATDAVVRAQRGRDATLGIAGIGFLEPGLGDHYRSQARLVASQRDVESGDTTADDEGATRCHESRSGRGDAAGIAACPRAATVPNTLAE